MRHRHPVFTAPFPLSRYLQSGSATTGFTFNIPINTCGTSITEPDPNQVITEAQMKTGFSNIIIIQMDEEVQEVWDTARKINCEWVNLIQKRVEFEPFEVEMLDFEEVKFEGDSVDCWMDLQVGKYPDSEEIHSAVKIGEQLSMLVYARDDEDMYDMHIKECFAYSSENYESSQTVKLQLTDEAGCVMKNKLMDGFYTRREPNSEGGTNIVAYGYLSAFKFPDVLDVFTTCEVEICKGGCRNKCTDDADDDEEGGDSLSEGDEIPETTTLPYREGVELFSLPLCSDPSSQAVDERCRQPKNIEVEPQPDCENSLTEDPRCPLNCNKSPLNSRCPPDCLQYAGLDPRCPCEDNPSHPRCAPDCSVQRGRDPRCPCDDEPLHTNCPPDCTLYAGIDERCPCSKLPTHPNCPAECEVYTGQDPRCPCQDKPFHRNCPADCNLNAGKDPRCPCSKFPLHPNCLDCDRFRGKDPRCPCEEDPTNRNCPANCQKFAGIDPRCPCSKFPLHQNCPPNCSVFIGQDPRCPCEANPTHKNCPPDCGRFAGQDPRCPCSKFPLHSNCPADCAQFAGKDPRCPCSKYPRHQNCLDCNRFRGKDRRCPCEEDPTHRNCPPNCELLAGKDPRCPCNKYPFHPNCPPNCKIFTGQDPRCPCEKNPFHLNCPPNCQLFVGQDPRCPCSKDPLNPKCPADCVRFSRQDPRCKPDCTTQPPSQQCQDFCEDNPRDSICEGVELFGQALEPLTTTTTTTKVPRTTPRKGRQEEEKHHAEHHGEHHGEHGGHHGHHGHHGDPRYHAFHSFHYDPGDGRRNRGGKKRIGKRSIDFEEAGGAERSKNTTGSARLVRHIRVISPDDLPHFDGGTLDWDQYHGHIRGAVCMSSLSFFSGLTTLLSALGITVFTLTVQCLKQRRRGGKAVASYLTSRNVLYNSSTPIEQSQSNTRPRELVLASENSGRGVKLFNTNNNHYEYKNRCDDKRLTPLYYVQ